MAGEVYDYIVIGGGPAGCCLANRLSADPAHRVLLLEAGRPDNHLYFHLPVGFAKLTGERATWGFHTVPQKHLGGRALPYAQGRVMGGGSSINAQVYTRGNRLDYDEWADLGCSGWSYHEILPYYKKWENNEVYDNDYHSTGGPVSVSNQITPHPICKVFLRAAQQTGLPYNPDFNGEKQDGCGIYQVFQANGRRCSAVDAYIRPAQQRANLTIKTATLVKKINIENKQAVGCEYIGGGTTGNLQARAAREVVLAAGAIGSPKLLLLSGIGPASELKKVDIALVQDLPGVGRNLHDHLDLYVVFKCSGPYSYDKHTQLHKTLWAGIQYYLFGQGPVTSNLAEAGGFWYANDTARSPDMQMHLMIGSGLEYGLEKFKGWGLTLNSAFLRPRSIGTVKLRSADPAAQPLIDPNYWEDPYDRHSSIQAFRIVRKIMNAPAFKPYLAHEILPGSQAASDDDIRAYAAKFAKTDYHPVGSCKMGTDDLAVVDPRLKVHEIKNLRVADSSIIPKLISSNTNAVTYMVAEKAADMILGKNV